MIKDRIIDDKISLKDLLAQAVCIGVRAGRGEIDYTSRGAWHIAEDILNETEEILNHRERVLGIRIMCVEMDYEISRMENKTLLERIKALLPTELYEDSKDWREGDVIERVEWLLSMYKWSRENVLRLEQDVLDLTSNL